MGAREMGEHSRLVGRLATIAVLTVVIAACSTPAASPGASTPGAASAPAASAPASPASPGASAESPAPSEAAGGETGISKIIPPTNCGDPVTYERSAEEQALLASLPAEAQSLYDSWAWSVKETPWSTFEGTPGPWKIGYITLPLLGPWHENAYNQLKADFERAKAAGLVTGDLQTYIQPDIASATPEQQIAAIQQMVASGVNGLIVHPLNAQAEAAAIDAAGEAGVPVVIQTDAVPNSKYAINNHAMVNISGEAAFLKLLHDKGWFNGEPRNTVYIRGIQGNSLEQAIHDATIAADSACPGIQTLGTLFTNWDNTTTKEQLLTFLASHPETIDFMPGEAGVTQGMIEAFQAAGREVPPIAFNQSFGGDYSWWLANKDKYETVGDSFDGGMALWSEFRILLRTLAGNGPKVNSIPLQGVRVTNDNIDQYAVPGLNVSDPGSLVGPPDSALNNEQMDWFFEKPGTPGGL